MAQDIAMTMIIYNLFFKTSFTTARINDMPCYIFLIKNAKDTIVKITINIITAIIKNKISYN